MKKITQQEFDKFEIVYGVKQCQTGDYSDINLFNERCSFAEGCSFAKGCSFAERCSFAEWCSFAERCSFENGEKYIGKYPFMAFIGAGSRPGSKIYFFNLESRIYVRCGCWFSSLKDFEKRVKSENADKLYLEFSKIVKKNFKR